MLSFLYHVVETLFAAHVKKIHTKLSPICYQALGVPANKVRIIANLLPGSDEEW